MACDLQFTAGTTKWKCKTKIYKFPADPNTYEACDFIMGMAGDADDIISVAEYFSRPTTTKPPKANQLTGLVLTEQGDIFAFNNYTKWIGVAQPYAAIGSGGPVALGVMASGGTPKEAIQSAIKHDIYSGFGVKVLRFN